MYDTKKMEEDTNSVWPSVTCVSSNEQSFDDNFTKINVNINENGLELPDSGQYINTLEKKLTSLRSFGENSCVGNRGRLFAKHIINELASKRDELFQSDDDINKNLDLSDAQDQVNNSSLCNAITQSNVYETIERKLFPQNHAIDSEELKNLPNSDLLDLLYNNDNPNQ